MIFYIDLRYKDNAHMCIMQEIFDLFLSHHWNSVTGYWLLVAGCWLLDTGCWMLDAGYWMLDAGSWLLDSACIEALAPIGFD